MSGMPGIINMIDKAPRYDVLAVMGNYKGQPGGVVGLETFLGAAGLPSDVLKLGRNTSGTTGLAIRDTNAGLH